MMFTKIATFCTSMMSAVFMLGFVASFVSALLAVRGLLRFISHHDFTVFAWYRIGFGIMVLFTAYSGIGRMVSRLKLLGKLLVIFDHGYAAATVILIAALLGHCSAL